MNNCKIGGPLNLDSDKQCEVFIAKQLGINEGDLTLCLKELNFL